MQKRILAGVLWFVAGAYLGAMVAYFVGVSIVLGPIIGLIAAFLVTWDPTGLIWKARRAVDSPDQSPQPRSSTPEIA